MVTLPVVFCPSPGTGSYSIIDGRTPAWRWYQVTDGIEYFLNVIVRRCQYIS
jgi:hypothetical protein